MQRFGDIDAENVRLLPICGDAALPHCDGVARALCEGCHEAWLLISADGLVLEGSDAASELLGFARATLCGMELTSIDLGADVSASPVGPAGGASVRQTSYRRMDGGEFPVEVRASATHLDGAPATLLVFRDISQRRDVQRMYDEIVTRASNFRKAIVELAKHDAMRSGDFALAAADLTEITSRALDVARASVWLLSDDRTQLRCVDLYDRRADKHSVGPTLRADDAPSYFEAVSSGRALDAHDARTDPRSSDFLDYMLAADIVGLLDAPIRVAGEVVGVVCHEQVSTPRRWRVEEVDFAGEVADQAALAFMAAERRRAEDSHRALEREMQRTRHFESLGVLAGGLAHDFNNLLMAIIGNADLGLRDAGPDTPMRRRLLRIEDAAQRASELTTQMLAYSGKGRVFAAPVELGAFVGELEPTLTALLPAAGRLNWEAPSEPVSVSGDREQLARVVVALVANAAEALRATGGEVSLRLYNAEVSAAQPPVERLGAPLADGSYAVLDIADDGVGLEPTVRQRAFDPFFTTKRARRGLGLPAALGIVRAHGGAVELHSRAEGGTLARVFLPCIEARCRPSAAPAEASIGAAPIQGCVLVVDDEISVREVATAILEDAGFVVIQARDGREAVDVVRERGDEVAMVLLDLTMPRLDGVGALREIRALRPRLPVILQSGYHEDDTIADLVGRGEAHFLEKPYGASALVERVRRVLTA